MREEHLAVKEAESILKLHTARENAIRGSFSFIAAASLLYMSAEYAEYAIKNKSSVSIPISLVCLSLAVLEASKVGSRVERILGLK